jgi:hypothetical protein
MAAPKRERPPSWLDGPNPFLTERSQAQPGTRSKGASEMTQNTSYRSNNVWSKARCLDRNPDDWFPEMGDRNGSQIRPVRQICASCPLRAKCLRIAISIHVESATTLTGIWGGLRAEEIRQAISEGQDIRQMLRTARVLAVKLAGKPGKTRKKVAA